MSQSYSCLAYFGDFIELSLRVHQAYPDLFQYSPQNVSDLIDKLDYLAELTTEGEMSLVLVINAHGNRDCSVFSFPHCRIKTKDVAVRLHYLKQKYPTFKCFLLLESCFSGGFDHTCCEGIVTSADDKHVSKGNLLLRAFDEVLQNDDKITISNIFDCAGGNSSSKKFDDLSRTEQSILAWDTSFMDKEFCKQSNLDITEFKDCAPTANGNIDEVLIPIIPKSIMNIVAKKASDENGTHLLTGEMLMKSLSDVTKKEYTKDHFFSSMTFRQLTSGRPTVNHQMVN